MEWKDVGEWIKGNAGGVAGLVGSLLVGNVPGALMAGASLVKQATGADDPETALAQLQQNPEAMVKLREIAAANEASIRDHLFKMEELRYADIADARRRETATGDSKTPRVLATVIVGGFLVMVWYVLSGQVSLLKDPVAAGLIGTLIGYVSAKADQVVSYYFGSSAGSAEKTALLARRS